MGLRDVSRSPGPDGDRASAPPLDRIHHVVVDRQARAERIGLECFAEPPQLAGLGIESPDLVRHGQNQIGAVRGHLHQHWSAPRPGEPLGLLAPDLAAGPLVEGHQRLALGRGGHNQQVFMQHGTGGRTPTAAIRLFPQHGQPQPFSVQVEGRGTPLAEVDIDPFAITDRSVRRVAIFGEHSPIRLFLAIRVDGAIPDDHSRLAVETDQVPLKLAEISQIIPRLGISRPAGHIDPLSHNNRGGRSRTRQPRFPVQVLFWTEPGGSGDGFRCHSGSIGAPEAQPVGGVRS